MALVSNDDAKSGQLVNAVEHILNKNVAQNLEPDVSHAKVAERNSGLREQLKSAGEISCATIDDHKTPVQIKQ